MPGAKNICVFLTGAIGDFVLALPALQRLRSAFPESHILLVGNPVWLPLACESLVVDSAVSMENLPLYAGFMENLSQDHRLSMFLSRFDLVLSWFGDREGQWERNLCRILPGCTLVVPFHRNHSFSGHVSEFYLRSLDKLGIPRTDNTGMAPWPPSRMWYPSRVEAIRGHGHPSPAGPGLCIHPGSGSREKNWPVEHFLEVATTVRERLQVPVQVLLGPAETLDSPFWTTRSRSRLHVRTNLSLNEVAETLSTAALYLGNDSGITHLAASLGVPTVAVFWSTDPRRWAPLGPRVRSLQTPTPEQVLQSLLEWVADAAGHN